MRTRAVLAGAAVIACLVGALAQELHGFKPIANPDGGYKYCAEPVCAAPAIDQIRGGVIVEGCAAGGSLGSVCRIGCMQGFEAAREEEGRCSLAGGGLLTEYVGQNVTCNPERNPDGTMSEAYCQLASTEAILDCCDAALGGQSCSRENPPTACTIECAEDWLPLFEDCEPFLGAFGGLSEACESVAGEFLNRAPSSLTLAGAECHPAANGVYVLQSDTIGGKAHWALTAADGQTFHFYSINVPHLGWAVGTDTHSNFLIIEDYEEPPPWGEHGHEWLEVCRGHTQERRLVVLTPSYTTGECQEELRLLTPELTEFCSTEGGSTFEELLATDTSLTDCPYDCAHSWFLYSEECGEYLTAQHPGLAGFTAACESTHTSMAAIAPVDGHLEAGGEDHHLFSSEQGLVYEIEESPVESPIEGENLDRTELAVLAPGTHHVVADRLDLTKQGAGAHTIEWSASQTELGVDIGNRLRPGSFMLPVSSN